MESFPTVLVLGGAAINQHKAGWFKTAGIYSLAVLEVASLQPLPEGSGGGLFPASPNFCGFRGPWLWLRHSNLCFCLTWTFLPESPLCASYRDTYPWFRAHPDHPKSLITSAKTLFPNKVTSIGSGGQDAQMSFGGGHHSTHYTQLGPALSLKEVCVCM